MSMQTSLQLLGGFELRSAAHTIYLPPSAQRLVALVAIRRRIGRQQVMSTLWPDVDRSSALRRLRTDLWRVSGRARQVLLADPDGIRLDPGIGVDAAQLDAHARLVLQQAGAFVDGRHLPDDADPAVFIDLLRWPAGLQLLPGWDHDWLAVDRVRLHQLQVHALEAAARLLLRQRRHGEALDAALQAQAVEPLRESAHALAIEIHLAQHNLVEAHRHYWAFAELLRAELGVEPSAQLRSLVTDSLARAAR
jgi:DNA-binding SARP family transcriptional activator